ncbi:hypothetical protein Tco_0879849 [Tanacetum coccineum]
MIFCLIAINNLRVLLANEGFLNVKLAYIGGLWVMIELDSTSTKEKFMQHVGVASWFARLCNAQEDFAKWGEVMKLEENQEDRLLANCICIKTSREDNILERFKITVRGKIYMIRAKELFMWSPIFKEPANTGYNSDKDADVGDHEINDNGNDYRNLEEESDIEAVSDTVEDNKSDNSISHPPGFTPVNVEDSKHRDRQEGSASSKSRTSEFCSRVVEEAQAVDDNPLRPNAINNRSKQSEAIGKFPDEALTNVIGALFSEIIIVGMVNVLLWLTIQLGGIRFHLSHPSAAKMINLNRFLVSEGSDFSYPHTSAAVTRFWKDHWIGDAPLYDLFPRLFSLEMNGDVTVATKLHGLLSDSFRRPVRGGIEAQQLAHRQNLVAWRFTGAASYTLNLNRRNIQTYMSMVESERGLPLTLTGMVVLVQGYSSVGYS